MKTQSNKLTRLNSRVVATRIMCVRCVKQNVFASLALIFVGWPVAVNAQEVAKFDKLVEQWLSVERQSSALESQWQNQKPLLEQRVALLTLQKQKLQAMLSAKNGDTGEVEQKRLALVEEQAELESQQTIITKGTQILTHLLVGMQAMIPPPVSETWQQENPNIATNPDTSRQLQVLVTQLTKLAEFDQRISVVQRQIQNEQGQTVVVKQLYVGASNAWFVSSDGSYSGTGVAKESGWYWQFNESEDSNEITKAIAIFEKQAEADFVSLPFTLVNKAGN